jgi:hypothetical protein
MYLYKYEKRADGRDGDILTRCCLDLCCCQGSLHGHFLPTENSMRTNAVREHRTPLDRGGRKTDSRQSQAIIMRAFYGRLSQF